jgi:hypothetical protein
MGASFAAHLLWGRTPAARATSAAISSSEATASVRTAPTGGRTFSPERRAYMSRVLPVVADDAVFRRMARELGVTQWGGKRLDAPSRASGSQRLALDQPVASADGSQNQPSISVDPTDHSRVVVFANNDTNLSGYDNACSIYLSSDGGFSFYYDSDVPLLNPTDFCAYPMVRYSPDGNVVYFSYLSIRDDSSSSDVLVTVGDGDDPTTFINGPTPVFGGSDFKDAPSIAVHTFDSADGVSDGGGYVHVVTTIFNSIGTCGVYFNHSTNYGASWVGVGGFGSLNYSLDCNVDLPHGGRIAAGPGAQVLVCYYHSGADGFSATAAPPAVSNKFNIRCRSSADRGATFTGGGFAATNIPYELNDYLSPDELYHRWYPAMFPSLVIDHNGVAHMVFTMDPTANKLDAEAGNVQYLRSTAAPLYSTWSARVSLGTGAKAQGYPTISAQRSNLRSSSTIYVAYYDHYRSPGATPNLLYDVRYRKSIDAGVTFGSPVTVTEVPSLSDKLYIGSRFDSDATMRRYHLVWTDRADKTSVNDYEDDVYSDVP